MYRYLRSLLLLNAIVAPLFGQAVRAADAESPQRLRVLTYNIHHAEGVDRKLDLQRIADTIKQVAPDIVALQEVDKGATRSENVDQPVELARLTGMQVVFGGNIKLQGGDYGNAVLSKLPIKKQQNHALPNVAAGEQRGVLELEIELPGKSGNLRFLATHLDHRSDDAERLLSAKAINALVAPAPDQPAILAGDLNAVPESEVLKLFRTVWTGPLDKLTIPVGKPARQIDYVLYKPAGRWKTVEAKVLDEAVASDHRALLVVLELLP